MKAESAKCRSLDCSLRACTWRASTVGLLQDKAGHYLTLCWNLCITTSFAQRSFTYTSFTHWLFVWLRKQKVHWHWLPNIAYAIEDVHFRDERARSKCHANARRRIWHLKVLIWPTAPYVFLSSFLYFCALFILEAFCVQSNCARDKLSNFSPHSD